MLVKDLRDVRIGTSQVRGVYVGTTKIWPLARTNLCPNPSFETNTTGWAQVYSPTGSPMNRSTAQAKVGSACVSIGSDGIDGPSSQGVRFILPVTVGATYTASMWARAAGAGSTASIVFFWFNSSNANFAQSQGASFTDNSSGWTQGSATGIAPAGAATAWVCLLYDNMKGQTHYVDSVLVEKSSLLSPYFDGDTADVVGGFQYSWTGTAHASTSVQSPPTPAAPPTPASLSGCVLGLDAGDVLAGPVTTWLDRSPQANHLVLSSGGAPVASSGYVTCTSSSVLQTSGNVNVTGAAPRHLFMKIRSRWVNGAFMGYGVSGNANLFDLWYYTGQGTLIWHGYGGGNDTVSGAPAMSPDVWHLVELSYDGSTVRVYMDEGTPQVTSVGTLLTVASPFLFGIGHYSPAGDFDMKGFYFYDRVLSGAERTQVLDYLRAK